MTAPDLALEEMLQPQRDLVIGGLLQAIASELEQGTPVRHEPLLRDNSQRIIRDGPLHLPRRGDLAVVRNGRRDTRRLRSKTKLPFKSRTIDRPEGFSAVINPFRWDAARLFVVRNGQSLDWSNIRRWYLEAFQSRYSDLAPDLDGAVHALIGPHEVEDGWEIKIDFGSVPIGAFSDMLDAFALSGVRKLIISDESRRRLDQTSDV